MDQIPYPSGKNVTEIVAADRQFVWHHLKPHRLFDIQEQPVFVEGKGLVVTDIRGRKYLDATSGGVWSVLVGYGRDSIADAVCRQMKILPYFAGVYGTIPASECAGKLLRYLPAMGKVFFSNSGSEANEKAIKMIRQASRIDPARKGKYKILYRDRDYHGTTLAALSASGQAERKKDFGPMLEGFVEFPHCCCYRCPFDTTYPGCDIECARSVEALIQKEGEETVGGLIVEPITAGGGILVPVEEYFPILQDICRKYKVWMVMDEVVCGFGRTGQFWGHGHFSVDPDIVTVAKGFASSYEAISATIVKQEIYDIFLNDPCDPGTRINFFRDISTYGGCTGPMAAALENIRIIEDEGLVENSRIMGQYLLKKLTELSGLPLVGDIRGRGLFCGVEMVADKTTKEPVTEKMMAAIMGRIMAQGVIVGRTNASIPGLNTTFNFAPALIINTDQIDTIVHAVKKAIEKEGSKL